MNSGRYPGSTTFHPVRDAAGTDVSRAAAVAVRHPPTSPGKEVTCRPDTQLPLFHEPEWDGQLPVKYGVIPY